MNKREPITNPKLIKAIETMRKNENADTIYALINEVLHSQFLAPARLEVEELEDDGNVKLKDDTKVEFHTLQTTEGKHYLMAFTDWEQLHRWNGVKNPQSIVLTFDDYANMVLSQDTQLEGFVINPFGENVPFSKQLIQNLKKQEFGNEEVEKEEVEGNVAVIEDTFALKDKGCILGCYVLSGELCSKDEVEVIDGDGNVRFSCVIEAMENQNGKITRICADEEEPRVGLMIREREKQEFKPGDKLRKKD